MGLLHDKKPLKYREFMDSRQWFYELSRHHDGSMGIVGNHHGGGGYDVPGSWGIGISLAYTIPRKTLRITGAPTSKFAKPHQLPKRPWGTAADETFFSMTPVADRNGKVQDWDAERLATDASWPILRRVNDPQATDAVLLMYARHPAHGVREMAALAIGMINDPEESRWVVVHALNRLAMAKPEVQALAVEVLGDAYAGFPKTLAATDGGLDRLYELAKRRFPEQALPHRDLFLGAPPEKLGPTTRKVMGPIISASLVPEHVGKNWKTLRALVAGEMNNVQHPGGRVDVMDQLADLYRRAGDTTDYGWHTFGPDRLAGERMYLTFDPPEQKLWDGTPRYRPVTPPAGMSDWFAKAFDPAKAGWKKGLGPFVNVGGKPVAGPCKGSPCACGDEPGTFWDKEVLLMRRSFALPPMKPGHRYRLLVGGRSHVGTGDGFDVYVNGRRMVEVKMACGRNSGGLPRGAFITSDWFDEFRNGGTMDVAAIAFLSSRKDKQNNINIWFEEMKMPPFDAGMPRRWASQAAMLSADWQAKQDPNRNAEDPEAGKYKWDGTVAPNPAVLGAWTTVAVVPSVEAFDPAKPAGANNAPFKAITFNPDGSTDDPLRLWTGDTLLDLQSDVHRPLQALKMTVKGDHFFVETGGFNDKNPVGWTSPLMVMKMK